MQEASHPPPAQPHGAARAFRFIWRAFAVLSLLAAALPLASQTSPQKTIPIKSFLPGMPITVNGMVYVTPATATVNAGDPLILSAPPLFDRGDGFRFRLLSWKIEYRDGRPAGEYATESVQLPDARDVSGIEYRALTEIRMDVSVSGPGTVVWDPPAPPDGFIPLTSRLKLTAVPSQNAFFTGWDAPWNYDGHIIDIGAMTVPARFTAHFSERLNPPPVLSTDSGFPDLGYGAVDSVLSGQVQVRSSVPMRVPGVETSCGPRNLSFHVSPISSTPTPFLLQAALTPENNTVPDGLYTCAILVNRYDGEPPFSIPFRVRIGKEEQGTPPAVSVNGASFVKMPMAPGAIFSLFGENIGLVTEHAASLPLPQSLGGVRVRIRMGSGDYDAPLFYVSPHQINFLVPLTLPLGAGKLEILREGMDSIAIPAQTEAQAPALFAANATGTGTPAGYYMRVKGEHQERGEFVNCPDGKECTPIPIQSTDPAEEVFLVLFGTGFRNTPSIRPQVHMGGMVVEAGYFGPHRDFVGLDQINVKVPRALLGQGPAPVTIVHGEKRSNAVTIEF